VIGGGFAGASCARALKQIDPQNCSVTLVEPNPTFTACPFSNGVIAGLRDLKRSNSAMTRSPRTA
jgi:sulfide dehydrogenase [flavocytochrome c] flavoprotein subunit